RLPPVRRRPCAADRAAGHGRADDPPADQPRGHRGVPPRGAGHLPDDGPRVGDPPAHPRDPGAGPAADAELPLLWSGVPAAAPGDQLQQPGGGRPRRLRGAAMSTGLKLTHYPPMPHQLRRYHHLGGNQAGILPGYLVPVVDVPGEPLMRAMTATMPAYHRIIM